MTPNTHHRALIAALSASVLCLGSCGKPVEEEVESETVVSVKTAAASLGTIRGLVHATGVVHPAPGAELVVVAPEAARIAEVPKGAGDPVRRGEVLVRFEIPQSLAEVERQQAEIARAQATLTNAKAAQTRAADLFERGVAARKEVEETTRASADAEAALAQARASLTAAETVAGRATVRATFNGIVARRQHNPGDLVEPTATDEVLRVIDPARLEVVASVPISDARITMRAFPVMGGGLVGPRTRLLDDRRPALDVVAHEGRKIGGAARRWSRALVLELCAHPRILQRRHNGGIEFVGDVGRQFGRAKHAEPGGRLKALHHLADRGQVGKRRLSLRGRYTIGS